jgi:predicted dehydrogenase
MQHFVDCVRNGQQPLSGVEDGLKTVAMAMAVYESARTGLKINLVW